MHKASPDNARAAPHNQRAFRRIVRGRISDQRIWLWVAWQTQQALPPPIDRREVSEALDGFGLINRNRQTVDLWQRVQSRHPFGDGAASRLARSLFGEGPGCGGLRLGLDYCQHAANGIESSSIPPPPAARGASQLTPPGCRRSAGFATLRLGAAAFGFSA